jgi:hypothetical protein
MLVSARTCGEGNASMQAGVNGSADEAESRWMTYMELAQARRIATSSAIKLVLRRGWRRQKDNHGTMRALVPPAWSDPAPGKSFDPDAHVSHAISALEASVDALRERAEAAENAVRFERERADRVQQALNGERNRANSLRDRIDALRDDLAEAEAAVEAARHEAWEATRSADTLREAEAEWQTLGLFARIRRAWRGE